MINPFVILIAGPTGVGKTTLSKMLARHFNCAHLSEDGIVREIFPNEYKNVEAYPAKIKIVETQLLKIVKEIFTSGECIVIDRINLEKEFIEEIRKVFRKHLILKVLWPTVEIAIERDKKRAGWTSGEIAVKRFYKKYEALKLVIGEENYIDNSHQASKETFENFLLRIEQDNN